MTPSLPPELFTLTELVNEHPELFAESSLELEDAALIATKYIFDLALQSESHSHPPIVDLLLSLSPSRAPQTRSRVNVTQRKRKRTPTPPPVELPPTPLASLFVEGMDDSQIWEQLDLRAKVVCETLEMALQGGRATAKEVGDDKEDEGDLQLKALRSTERKAIEKALKDRFGIEPEDVDTFLAANMDSDDDSDEDMDDGGEEGEEGEDGKEGHLGESVEELRDPSSSSEEDDEYNEEEDEEEEDEEAADFERLARSSKLRPRQGDKPSPRHKKASALDDGFFDLISFNAETAQAEAKRVSDGSLAAEDDDEEEEEEVDLFKPVDDLEQFDEEDLEGGESELYYKDFFEAPSRNKNSISKPAGKPKVESSGFSDARPTTPGKVRFHEEVRVRNIKAEGRGIPVAMMGMMEDEDDEDEDEDEDDETLGFGMDSFAQGDDEDNMGDSDEEDDDGDEEEDEDDEEDDHEDSEKPGGRSTIERLKDDLFAEDPVPEANLTTHEKRQAALREQIASLEAENVGTKDWVLMGEASSRSRPKNSLLEEDLEFERVMKPVPVITEEVVQGLEQRIKARILEGKFDDVVRLREPREKAFLPSRLLELKDSKSELSLAQIYEGEYTAAQVGGIAGEDRDGKLKKEHEEIEKLWEGVCWKLDALCNAHFIPKQPKATISTVANVSTTTLESSLPTTQSISTLLAPEEIFTPSSSDPRARSEMTPAEKRTVRAKMKKSRKKMRDALDKHADKVAKMNGGGPAKGIGGIKKQKEKALESVVKTGRGVTVVGKKGVKDGRKSRIK